MEPKRLSQSIDRTNSEDFLADINRQPPTEVAFPVENENVDLVDHKEPQQQQQQQQHHHHHQSEEIINLQMDEGKSTLPSDYLTGSNTALVQQSTGESSHGPPVDATHRRIAHNKKRSSVGVAFDSGKKILEDGARGAYKFCCFVISTGKQLIHYKDLPKWLQDNDFIRYFYRPELKSFKLCFKSVFSLHSETGNIWTHIIGVLIMMVLGFVILLRPTLSSENQPKYPNGALEYCLFIIFFICACTCMTFSWLFHTLSCHSEKVYELFAKMDYMGISLLITGSSIPVLYFGFYCSKTVFYVYLGVILGLCFSSILVSLLRVFATPKLRPVRATVFLTFGLSNIVPIIHVAVLNGYEFTRDAVAVYYLIIMGTLYVSGALLYSMRVPERLFPGKITLFFQSHQIFHVLVVIAAVIHAFAICKMAQYRVAHSDVPCPPNKPAA